MGSGALRLRNQTNALKDRELVWYQQPWRNRWLPQYPNRSSGSYRAAVIGMGRSRKRSLQAGDNAAADADGNGEPATAAAGPAPTTLHEKGECTLLSTVAFCASFSNDIEGCRAAFEEGF